MPTPTRPPIASALKPKKNTKKPLGLTISNPRKTSPSTIQIHQSIWSVRVHCGSRRRQMLQRAKGIRVIGSARLFHGVSGETTDASNAHGVTDTDLTDSDRELQAAAPGRPHVGIASIQGKAETIAVDAERDPLRAVAIIAPPYAEEATATGH